MANQVDFKILPSDQFNVYSPQTRSEKIITYFTLLSKLRGDILAVSSQDDPNDIVSAYYSNVGGTQTLHLVKADGSEVTASQPQQIISGTVNYISKFTTSNDIGNSLLYDDGTNVGIGTTSMTHRLQLGTGGVFADYFQLDTTYSNGFVTGALSWDIDNGTMDVGLSGTLKLKVGQDDVWYVKNQTGSTIAKGVAVYANGTLGASGRITVAPMIANGTIPAKYFLGITAEAIANGADGYVLAKGKLRQIDTNAYNEGDVLWVSPSSAGALTNTEPTAPNLKLPVAFVVYKANNGILAIRATTGARIEDASDVNYTGALDNSFLIYNSSTGVWEDETVGIFKTIAVSGQSDIVADNYTDTLTVASGTGISLTTNASTDTLTITNSAPDQTVVLTAGTGITVSGTYPSFTITNSSPSSGGTVTSIATTAPITGGTITTTGTIGITQATTSTDGYLSSTDWNTFNNKASDAFKTIAVAGQSSVVADSATDTLTFEAGSNIVITTDAATDKITISAVGGGTGSVTSVDMTVPTGFAISGNPITSSGTLALAFASGYSLPTDASQSNWNTAYDNSITAFSYNTSTGVLTLTQQDAGTLTATVTLAPFTTTNLAEGTNLYFTTSRARQSLSAGIGISYDNSTGVITNSAPDQIVSLSAGTGISTSGTYPSFTITNTAPDQTVTITAGTGISVSGTYPSFTIANTGPTGSGTTNYVTKWTSTSVIGNSQIFDNGTNVGIGTATPAEKLQVNGLVRITNSTFAGIEYHNTNGTWELYVGTENGGGGARYNSASSQHTFYNNGSAIMRINSNGNVGIGTTSPSSKLHVAGTVSADAAFADSGAYRIIKPNGGVRTSTSGSETGAIKITYPVGYTNTMHRVKLNVYEYITNQSFTIYFGGYPYAPGTQWYNEFAYILNNSAINRNFTVRFGYDGSKMVVYIGELSSTWSYLQVFIEEVELGYSGMSDTWRDGAWSIGLEASAFQGVNATVSNTQATNWGRSGNNTYYSFGNVGIGTTSPNTRLRIVETSNANPPLSIQSTNTDGYSGSWLYDSAGTLVGHFGWANGTTSALSDKMYFGTIANKPVVFTTNDSEKVRITAAGNVGIGTSAPDSPLEINGRVSIRGANELYFGQSTSAIGSWTTRMYASGSTQKFNANEFIFNNEGYGLSEFMRITSAGNVGIGTTAPKSKLDISGNISITNTSISGYGEVIFYENSSLKADIFVNGSSQTNYAGANSMNIWQGSNAPMAFYTNGTNERMRITGAGNIGIGTTDPQSKVDIVGVLRYGNNAASIGALSYGSAGIVTLEAVSTNTSIGILPSGTGKVGINTISPDTMLHVVGDIKVTGGYYDSSADIGSAGQFLKSTGTGTNWTTVNVIDGSGTANYVAKWSDSDTITDSIIFDNGTNVGIGTASPGSKLDILSSANPFITVRTASYAAVLGADTTNGYIRIGAGTNHAVGTVVNGTIRTWLDTDGNLSVGTTVAKGKLTVVSAISSTAPTLYIESSTSGSGLYGMIAAGDSYHGLVLRGKPAAATTFEVTAADEMSFFEYGGIFNFYQKNNTGTFSLFSRIANGSATYFNGGNVGIGTIDPTCKLTVDSSAGFSWGFPSTASVKVGTPGTGGSFLVMTPSLNASYESGLSIDGTYNSGKTVVNINAFGVYSGGPYSADMVFKTSTTTTLSEKMRITNDGNVGINQTAPLQKLDVYGNISLGSWVKPGSTYVGLRRDDDGSFGGGGDSGLVIESYNHAAPYNGNYSQRVHLRTHLYNGGSHNVLTAYGFNVGIGTTTPGNKLAILAPDTTGVPTLGTNQGHFGIFNGNLGGSYGLLAGIINNGNAYLQVQRIDGTATAYNMLLQPSGGNVGIGETSPSTLVHLNRSNADSLVTSTPSIIISNRNSTSGSFIGGGIFNNTYRDVSTSSITAGIYFLNKNSVDAGALAKVSDIIFATGSYSTDWVAPDEKMRLTNSGLLGLGVSAPTYKLHISAGTDLIKITSSNTDARINIGHSGNGGYIGYANIGTGARNNVFYVTTGAGTIGSGFIVDNDGNVGIGTAAPDYALDVYRSSGAGARVRILGTTNYVLSQPQNNSGALYMGIDDSSGSGFSLGAYTRLIWSSGAYPLAFAAGDAERMRLTSGGNVLIGTATDNGYKLSVNGSGYFNGTGYFENRVQTNNSFSDANNVRVLKPLGGSRNSFSGSETGAIKITYPVGYTNTMHRVKLNIYNYAANQAYTVYFGGYNYGPGPYWVNTFAYTIGPSSTNFNPTVRFGYDGAKMVVYIGELNSSWSYPQFFIEEVECGFNLASQFATDAWSIGLEASAFQNVTSSIGDTLSTNWARNGSSTYYGFGNVGIGTAAPGTPLGGALGLVIDGNANGDVQFRLQANSTGRTSADGGLLSISGTTMYLWNYENDATIFGTNNSERLRITAGGNVGIGTTSPTAKLYVSGNATDNVGLAYFENTSSGGIYYPAATFINNNGNHSYGIVAGFKTGSASGTDRPSILFYSDLSAHSWSVGQVTSGWGSNDSFGIGYRASNDPNSFGNWPSNYFTITTGGNVGIGTTSPGTAYRLVAVTGVGQTGAIQTTGSVNIGTGALGVNVTPSATAGRIDASNDIVAYSTSDKRLKENIKPIENALEKVKSLTGVEFDWIEETKDVHGYEGHDVGVIAQEVQAVLPEAIRTNESGYLSVRYEKMIALLIEANKELTARVEELEKLIK
jgi:hypothetical protein